VISLTIEAEALLPNLSRYSSKVEIQAKKARELISQAKSHLIIDSYNSYKHAYDSYMLALANAQSAMASAVSADAIVKKERREAEQQKKRNERSVSYARTGAALGTILTGFAGCISCLNTYEAAGKLVTPFNLISGAIIGCIIGAILGLIIGQLTE
jgi:sorbitol-specific phosphotransferase system component IIBC